MVVHEIIYSPADQPSFVVLDGEKIEGLLTYLFEGSYCEILTLDSRKEGRGAGSELIEARKKTALREGCDRLWLITTNDNIQALHFYQKRGFTFAAVHTNTLEKARTIKPEIPFIGEDGIPIRDESELEIQL